MKQFFLILAFLMACTAAAFAQNIKLVPSADDSTRIDTVVVSELADADGYESGDDQQSSTITYGNTNWDGNTVAIIAIIICCGLPFFIVAIVLWFRYKNKQAKYRLAAEALAAGQNIPKELFSDAEDQNQRVLSKGIKNIFLGIGLGVFFWLLTEEIGLAAIGFLIFCMGLGQVVIAYTTGSSRGSHGPIHISKDENGKRTVKVGNIEMERNDKTGERNIKLNTPDESTEE